MLLQYIQSIGDKCYNLYTNGSYDRDAAVAYATNQDYTSEEWQNEDSFLNWKKHTRKHNPQYQRCDDYSYYLQGHLHGSDCANFVSQVLYAGGVESNEYWNACLVPDAKGEVIQGSNYVATASWINVQEQFKYLQNNGYIDDVIEVNSAEDISECIKDQGILQGDLMYLKNDSEGIHHALVITKIENGHVSISAHSNDRINYEVTDDFLDGNSALIVKMH